MRQLQDRASLWALITIYSRLRERIEHRNHDVFRRRVRLTLWEKSWIVWRAANEAARTIPGDACLTATIKHTILCL
jgi:phytoene/squalene synthetase